MTEITCITCGIKFKTHDCYIKRDGKRLYCSIKCRNFNGENNPRYNKYNGWTKCVYCGIDFKIKPSQLKNNKGRTFCNIDCKNKNQIDYKHIYNCIECGKEIHGYISRKRKFCSRTCASVNNYRKNNQMNNGIQRGNGGKRDDLNNMYVRSSWEANYARYLNFLIKNNEISKWEYEVDTFEFTKIKKGTRFYTPDFKVYDKNGNIEYHEVKGWMDEKSITRHNRMTRYYPNIKVRIIDKKWFRANGTMLSKIIKGWEVNGINNKRLY